MKHSARRAAIKDIRIELRQESKSFIAFRTSLTPAIRNIVKEYIKMQDEINEGKA